MIRPTTSETKVTTCNRDCPDACTIEVTVEGGRATRLSGHRGDPVTRGFLCERTNRFLYRQYSADRITHPMLRKHGELVAVSWDEAMNFVAERLLAIKSESGPEAIFHYRSGGSLGLLKTLSSHLFEQFGPVTVKRGDICSGAGEAAQATDFGVSDSHDLFDLLNSRVIVCWGKNPHTSGPHVLPVLRDAKERGAKIIGIDPVRTKASTLCDEFIAPRPGGDFHLAMGMARRLFDQGAIDDDASNYCDHFDAYRDLAHRRTVAEWAALAEVDVDQVERLGDVYRDGPSAILVGWGMARRGNGAATVRALDALGAVSGNLGVAGGGVSYYFGRRGAFDTEFVTGAAPRTISETCLGPELLAADPPVRAMWVTAGNPVAMIPQSDTVREALLKTEFVCVVDTHFTDTTDVADVVLPTLTLLEDSDLMGAYGNHWLRVSEPAIDGPGEVRHELEIWQDLAHRLGVEEALAGSVDDWKRRMMRRLEDHGVTLDDLKREPQRNPFSPKILFADRKFPTASGRVNLITDDVPVAAATTDEFPLSLMAISTPKAQSSQWSVPIGDGAPEVRVHPSAAGAFGDGDEAVIESAVGSLGVTVRHDERVHPRIALMAKGGERRHGRCANALVRARETDMGGGANFYDEPVRLVAK